MLFNSFEFFVFFPVAVLTYFNLPPRYRTVWLLVASSLFYMAFVPAYILILFFTILVDYFAGLAIERATGPRRKAYLWISIAANVGVLAVFKYAVFFAGNANALLGFAGFPTDVPVLRILLPVGLSFHTFQAMSYTMEVYRGRYRAERSFPTYALYVMFFPQLVAGPIERPQHLLPQFREVHTFNPEDATEGLRLMLWGFFKKIVVADRLALYVNPVYTDPLSFSPLANALATVCFAFQIYCDFSGYSDIAIGSARVMGFRLMTNFRQPYFATSVTDFWRRWHISLSTWFRDYVYIPLGGSRATSPRVMANIFTVFLLSGLWHGAGWTFVVWGAIHGLVLIVERASGLTTRDGFRSPVFNLAARVSTFSIVCIAWIFFRATSMAEAGNVLSRIFSFSWRPGETAFIPQGVDRSDLLLMIGGVAAVLAIDLALEKTGGLNRFAEIIPKPVRWAAYYAAVGAILLLGVWGRREFIYYQF
ncbi:MAG: MBOAT family O-acyltransferase [Gemmatimonadaceae bacterium]